MTAKWIFLKMWLVAALVLAVSARNGKKVICKYECGLFLWVIVRIIQLEVRPIFHVNEDPLVRTL